MTYYPKTGNTARTRDGREVTQIVVFEGVEGINYPVLGVLDGVLRKWTKQGFYLRSGSEYHPLDLVGPWEKEWRSLRDLDVKPGDIVRHCECGERVIGDTTSPRVCRTMDGSPLAWNTPHWKLVSRAPAKDQTTDWSKVKPGTPVEVKKHRIWVSDYFFVGYHKAPDDKREWVAVAYKGDIPQGMVPSGVRLAPTPSTPAPVMPKVKPLVWDQRFGGNSGWFADGDMGVYRVVAPNGGVRWVWELHTSFPRRGVLLDSGGDEPEDAMYSKAEAVKACEARREARIRSQIDMDPVTVQEAAQADAGA